MKPPSTPVPEREELAWLRRLARIVAAGERSVADDLAQEAMLVAMRGGGPSDPDASRAWLTETMRRLFFGHVRTAVRRRRREQHWHALEPRGPADLERAVLDAEARAILRQELAALPEHHRAILRARFLEGRRADAIAAEEGVPAATVRSRTHAAVAALRARVQRRYEHRSRAIAPLLPAGALAPPAAFWLRLREKLSWAQLARPFAPPALAVALALLLSEVAGPTASQATASRTRDARRSPLGTGGELAPAPSVRLRPLSPAALADTTAGAPPAALDRALLAVDDACPSAQPLLDAAPAGATVRLPPCIHRETLRVRRRLHVVGEAGAEIRGSDVFSFDPAPGGWISRQHVPLPNPAAAAPGEVFRDGVPLTAVERLHPGPGEYRLLPSRRLFVTDPPAGHLFEVSVRGHWMFVEAAGVIVEGVTMRHAANDRDDAALMLLMSREVTVRRANLQLARGGLVGGGGEGVVLEDSVLAGAGAAAMQTWGGSFTVRGNQFIGGNRFGMSPMVKGSALEGYATRLLVEDNHVIGNNGPGVRCVKCASVSLVGNTISDNRAAGISLEYVTGARVENNRLSRNGSRGWPAIMGNCSRDAVVRGNLLAGNGAGIWVRCPALEVDVPTRERERLTVVNNAVHDNTVVSATRHPVLWISVGDASDETLAVLGNGAWGNAFSWPDAAAPYPFEVSGRARSWEQFRGSAFGTASRRLIAAEAEWSAFVLGAPPR